MTMTQLTAVELLSHYKKKSLSPVDVVDQLFEKIHEVNPSLNAFVTLNEDEARSLAQEAEEKYKNDEAVRPLEGIPIAIKDLTHTKGIRTTYGSPLFKDYIPDRDATVVKRLKDAGAIIMGKTNTPEFGYKGTTDNPLFGPTRNPWDLETNAGGSSGGSAAAVSAGLVPIAEGSDGGGSIRIPAALCGIYGFKPSYGRMPHDNHLGGIFGSHEPFLHSGTLTRSVEDAALMYDIMKGFTTTDPFVIPDNGLSAFERLNQMETKPKIGWTLDFGMYEVDEDVAAIFMETIDRLSEAGFEVQAAEFDMKKDIREYIEYFEQLWTVGLAASCQKMAEEHPEAFSEGLLKMIERGKQLSAIQFKALEKDRAYYWHLYQSLWEKYDILLSPTLATPAFQYDWDGPPTINGKKIKADSDWVMTQIYNITGFPAISLPAGLTPHGLPVGVQAATQRLEDEQLLQFARYFETHLPALAGAVNQEIKQLK
ncbi:amidase/aspartyl-tRNA(Asn)/glutamyl-tRNA(Gln) amidotransferase subunit A [Pullulanibacillus pueri]|uniref:Amidase n=1 Tax=Pullulanibacillus pueri TaxID=1437324 RepID=A0A8J2ZZ51_9BACL|nr:amidase [Pullulanibacillus pueri]MBM7683843.1 amidase/aspartyl-tRNA(Asn)/glutamyl-tRNA(Gln) amidotransferase subunit A [Pullulanibacillus pueri]GGH87714.1 amidase [Pullulanibacillus pueri]